MQNASRDWEAFRRTTAIPTRKARKRSPANASHCSMNKVFGEMEDAGAADAADAADARASHHTTASNVLYAVELTDLKVSAMQTAGDTFWNNTGSGVALRIHMGITIIQVSFPGGRSPGKEPDRVPNGLGTPHSQTFHLSSSVRRISVRGDRYGF